VVQLVGDGVLKGLPVRHALEQAHAHLAPVHKAVVEQVHGDVDDRIQGRAGRKESQHAPGDFGRVDLPQPGHPAFQEIHLANRLPKALGQPGRQHPRRDQFRPVKVTYRAPDGLPVAALPPAVKVDEKSIGGQDLLQLSLAGRVPLVRPSQQVQEGLRSLQVDGQHGRRP
jgi:hypothetical protein